MIPNDSTVVVEKVVLETRPCFRTADFRGCLPAELAPLELFPPEAASYLDNSLTCGYLQALGQAWRARGYLMRLADDENLSSAKRRTSCQPDDVSPGIRAQVQRDVQRTFLPAALLRRCVEQQMAVQFVLVLRPDIVELRASTGRPATYRRYQLSPRLLEALTRLSLTDPTWPAGPQTAPTDAHSGLSWMHYLDSLRGRWLRSAQASWTGLLTSQLSASPFWPWGPEPLPIRQPNRHAVPADS